MILQIIKRPEVMITSPSPLEFSHLPLNSCILDDFDMRVSKLLKTSIDFFLNINFMFFLDKNHLKKHPIYHRLDEIE